MVAELKLHVGAAFETCVHSQKAPYDGPTQEVVQLLYVYCFG